MTLMSVLLAIGVAEILSGWGGLLRSRHRVRIYPLFLYWSVFLLFMAINIWTQYWGYQVIEFVGYKVVLLLLQVLLLVLAAYQLTPNVDSMDYNMEAEYWRLSKSVFPTIALMFLAVIPTVAIVVGFEADQAWAFFVPVSVASAVLAAASFSLAFTRRVWVHWLVAVLVFVLTVPSFLDYQLSLPTS